MTYIQILGDMVYRTNYEDLPEEIVAFAKARLIDTLAIAFAGYRNGLHKPALAVYRGSAGNRSATAIAEGSRLFWTHAALLNSSMCPADMTDGERRAALHPSAMVIPAALAAFEAANSEGKKLTGKELLTAIVLGYDLMIRIGRVMNPSAVMRGFHLTPVVGPLASAAAVGKILGLDLSQLKNALSLATTLGAGLFDAFKAPEPFVEIQVARACEAGMCAAALAEQGIPGNDEIIEKAFIPAHSDKYRLECMSEDLSKPHRISQTYIKIHGGCRHLHTPIDTTLAIVKEHGIRWEDIAKIHVKTYSVAETLAINNPKTADDAKFNMEFAISVALIRGNALPDQFSIQNLNDPRIQGLMKKISYEVDKNLDKDYPEKRAAIVEVMTKGGNAFAKTLDLAKGEPESPVTRGEINEKFRMLTSGLIPEAQVTKAIEFIDTIEDRKDLRDLFAYLTVRK
jgi:2-methylcitrate dehydratase PrpD